MGAALKKVTIFHYRSIDKIEITFPSCQPVVLFGPNNAGKSNILSAIHRLLGDKYPTYIEMLDSDYFMRNKRDNPRSVISAEFSENIWKTNSTEIGVIYDAVDLSEIRLCDGKGKKLYVKGEQRREYQSCLVEADRNIQASFNYGSRYSLLSKFSHNIHAAINSTNRKNLKDAYKKIKNTFESIPEYSQFFDKFSQSMKNAVKGFVHSLEVDFSAYDPNNYAKSLRIQAKEGDSVRGFEEFGTGEQQVLLMAFVKAYMEVFTAEHFLLIIEEPEAHLHPLAQKWLKEYLGDLCQNGLQVIISTHSASFLDARYLEGLVRVYKEREVTHVKQISAAELARFCAETGVPEDRVSEANISDFYATKLFPDQLEGVFAEKILLVEGESEFFALPVYFKKIDFSLPQHGIEILNCRGKEAMPLFWRLFSAYGYQCYMLFDGDGEKATSLNSRLFAGIIDSEKWETGPDKIIIRDKYAYFGKDFESYCQKNVSQYAEIAQTTKNIYHINTKPGIAYAVARHSMLPCIHDLKEKLRTTEPNQ